MVGDITFSGLLSGISTDEIIAALVDIRRQPINQLETLAEQQSFQRKAFQVVNQSVLNFQSSLLNLRLERTFLSKLVESSNSSLLTATAGFNAVPATHSVTISSIASGARATSGLNNKSLERAAIKLVAGNTAGIATIAMTANNLGGTRALSDTLLTDTLQSGTGSSTPTQGDRIKIDVTLKDGSSNTAYFTFQNNASDTMERLRQTILSAFQGEAQVSIDANGGFLITETDPSTATEFSLDGLTFIDEDFSGSTFSIALGNTTAANMASSRLLVGTRTFTTNSSQDIADGTELLTALDQFSGGSLTGDETIEISGTQYDGDSVSTSFAITGATTLNDLIAQLESDFNDGANPPWETTVTLENGKLVLRDQATGSSETEIFLSFDDPDGSLSLSLGSFAVVDEGSSDNTKTIRTSGFTSPAEGKHLVTSTDGRGGIVTGTVSLTEDTILSSLGVTETGLFTIDRDNGSGIIDPVSIIGLTGRSTVRDLVDAINSQVPGVTAQLVDDGGGAYNFQIAASQGGVDLRLTDESTGVGILENVLNLDTVGIDSDISTLTDSGLAAVESATTVSTDYTLTTIFTPDNGGPIQRRTVVGTDGTPVTDLIENAQISGSAGAFDEGIALFYSNQSSELNVGPATSSYLFGSSGVADPARTSTPSLNILTYADNSGLEIPLTSGTFSINGVQIQIDNTSTQTLDEIMGLVNSSGAGVVMEYNAVHDRFEIHRPDAGNTSPITVGAAGDTSNFLTALGLTAGAGAVQFTGTVEDNVKPDSSLAFSGLSIPTVSGTFTINGVKITVNAGADSLNDIIKRINDSSAGVTASYDSAQDRLILVQDLNEPPLYNKIQIGSATDTSNFLSSMRLTDSYQVSQAIGSSRVKAEFTVDGQSYIRDKNEIDDVLNDVTFTLKGSSETPISLDVSADTTRATEAIRDFVVSYNEMVQAADVPPLTDDERDGLLPLSDAARNKLTFSEIDQYEQNRELYYIQNTIFNSTTVRRLDSSARLSLFSPVRSAADNAIRQLSELGITTGDTGLGVDLARSPYLVADSTDPDEIMQKLESNTTLQNALLNKADEVQNLFMADQKSTATATGNIDLSLGVALGEDLVFTISNGNATATVTLDAGFTPASKIISEITNALSQVGLAGIIDVDQTDGGFLELTSETGTGRARLIIQDVSGEGIANTIGIGSQSVTGTNAADNAGLARRLDNLMDAYSGIQGVINEKIKLGGFIDQELIRIAKRIDDMQYRLDLYQQRLQREFAQMEVSLTLFSQTSSFLTSRLNAAQALSQSSNSSTSFG